MSRRGLERGAPLGAARRPGARPGGPAPRPAPRPRRRRGRTGSPPEVAEVADCPGSSLVPTTTHARVSTETRSRAALPGGLPGVGPLDGDHGVPECHAAQGQPGAPARRQWVASVCSAPSRAPPATCSMTSTMTMTGPTAMTSRMVITMTAMTLQACPIDQQQVSCGDWRSTACTAIAPHRTPGSQPRLWHAVLDFAFFRTRTFSEQCHPGLSPV